MKILVAVDPDDIAFETLLRKVASVRRQGDSVHVLHVLPAPINWYDSPSRGQEPEGPGEQARRKIAKAIAQHNLDDVEVQIQFAARSNPGSDIAETAVKVGASLIMIATQGQVWRGLFIGSVAERVLRLAECDVYVVRAPRG